MYFCGSSPYMYVCCDALTSFYLKNNVLLQVYGYQGIKSGSSSEIILGHAVSDYNTKGNAKLILGKLLARANFMSCQDVCLW